MQLRVLNCLNSRLNIREFKSVSRQFSGQEPLLPGLDELNPLVRYRRSEGRLELLFLVLEASRIEEDIRHRDNKARIEKC